MKTLQIMFALCAICAGGCRPRQDAAAASGDPDPMLFAAIAELPSPAGPGSGEPQLSVGRDGRVFLSWLEPSGNGRHRMQYAERLPSGWGGANTIAEGETFFVNWADVPSIVALADGSLAAHWLDRSGPGKYAYDVRLSVSNGPGQPWSAPITPHRDRTETEHGFVSLFDWPGGGLGAVWLDGRDFAQHSSGSGPHEQKGDMALRAAVLSAGHHLNSEALLDARICECCPTAAAPTLRGVVVAYRDRSGDEIRDIFVTRYENGAWSKPYPVHRDNWKIPGCPVNGPALAAIGSRVALAWFNAADNDAKVLVAFSDDGGRSFGAPVRADDGVALGRVDVELLPDGSAAVSWIEFGEGHSHPNAPERVGGPGSELRARRIGRSGARGPSAKVTAISGERASGYPRMARAGQELIFTWTATGERAQVKTAIAPLTAGSKQ